jgi:hypothetical protein
VVLHLKQSSMSVDVARVDLWDWLDRLFNFLLDNRWGLRMAMAVLLLCCLVIWLKVPYFHV